MTNKCCEGKVYISLYTAIFLRRLDYISKLADDFLVAIAHKYVINKGLSNESSFIIGIYLVTEIFS